MMSASTVEQLLELTAESNMTMRNQIKRQQLSLLALEKRVKERKLSKPKLIVPPGKMLIKAKGLVMRVRNEKAIADELGQIKHERKTLDEELPSFNTKNAPNLIIQSQIQNTPAPVTYNNRQDSPSVYHPPPAPAPVAPAPYHHPAPVPMYYTPPPPPPVLLQKPVKYVQQPVQYVEEYVEEPPAVYKVRKPYSRPHYVHPEPVIVYERSPPREYRSRPVEYRRAPHSPNSWRRHSPPRSSPPRSSPPRSSHHRSHYSSHHTPAIASAHASHHSRHSPVHASHHADQVSYTTSRYRQKNTPGEHEEHYSPAPANSAVNYPNHSNWKRPTSHNRRPEHISSGPGGLIKHDIRTPTKHDVHYKVLVSNLHPSVSIQDIEELFNAIDVVEHIQMLYPGVAEVTYLNENSAAVSVDRYHNRDLDGQPMQISYTSVQVPRREHKIKSETKMYRNTTRLQHSTPHFSPRRSKLRGRAKYPGPPRHPPLSDAESTHSFTVTM